MFVKDFMTKDPIVIQPKASISAAKELMDRHKLKRLPVIDQGKLVGLVTETDLMKALPSSATTLSKHEINYLTSQLTVAEIMSREVITTTPDATIEEAVMIMRSRDIGCLPVVTEQIVGIITESNVFDALTKLLGLNRAGLRMTVLVEEKTGVLAEITGIIRDLGIPIISLATLPSKTKAHIILRLAVADSQPVAAALTDKGFTVVHSETLTPLE